MWRSYPTSWPPVFPRYGIVWRFSAPSLASHISYLSFNLKSWLEETWHNLPNHPFHILTFGVHRFSLWESHYLDQGLRGNHGGGERASRVYSRSEMGEKSPGTLLVYTLSTKVTPAQTATFFCLYVALKQMRSSCLSHPWWTKLEGHATHKSIRG